MDIILDCVGGSYAMKNVSSLAVDGRWVLYGLMGGVEVESPVLAGMLRKRGSLLATTWRSRNCKCSSEDGGKQKQWQNCIDLLKHI